MGGAVRAQLESGGRHAKGRKHRREWGKKVQAENPYKRFF